VIHRNLFWKREYVDLAQHPGGKESKVKDLPFRCVGAL
jgi:hypothetical protein